MPWRSWLIFMLFAQMLACATTPVGVRRVSASDVHRALTANVLTAGEPSPASTQILNHLNLVELYEDDPDAAIESLRVALLATSERSNLLFALAELEFHRGKRIRRTDARPHFLASAFYAESFLRSVAGDEVALALDPRIRLVADLYNRGLALGLATDNGEYVDVTPRTLPLSFGELVLGIDESDLRWGGYRMIDFVPVAELEVRGLRNRYRSAGIGVPLAVSLEFAQHEDSERHAGRISRGVRVAATALIRFRGGLQKLDGEVVGGELRLFTLDDATTVDIGGRVLPLEYEPTAALAFGLAESSPWSFERRGLFSGDFGRDRDRGLHMLAPYDPARIPVVFVHGTASSPARWAEMINHLRSDPEILARYQFWIFQYNTGNPIPFSAGLLRQSLVDLVAELDPDGDDENLRRVVVIGHSQGGLLTKLCVVESGNVFWEGISTAPVEDLDLRPETREIIERSLFFKPLPFVERVIFIATPHRGSFVADRRLVRFATRFIAMPQDLADAAGDLFGADDDRILLRGLDDMPTSLDNMTSDNRFGRTLAKLPISSGVEAHSIIAVLGDPENPETGDDGVVTVESARIEGVESELIVRSGHSTQLHPLTIGEVRRILRDGLP